MDKALKKPGSDLLDAARRAHEDGDLPSALELWAEFRQARPKSPDGFVEACRALRRAGRLEEAEALSQAAIGRGDRLRVMIEHARIAEARGDLAAAVERGLALARAFPTRSEGPVSAAQALLKQQRLEAAETLLTEAAGRIPDNAALGRLLAQVASARGDWPLAMQRWDAVLARHPEDQVAIKGRGATLWQAQLAAGNAAAGGDDPAGDTSQDISDDGLVDVGRATDPEAHDLVLRFESIGQNCEFGLVQRRFGAEPLGLLRWTFVKPPVLARMLETRFAGLGEPENVVLRRSAWREWYIYDRVFKLGFHTFQATDLADPDGYVKKQAARLRWLRDKLLEDLEEGGKIFVYKPRVETPDQHMQRIFTALRSFSRARLLCIGLAGEAHAPGTVSPLPDGHLRGYLSVHNPLVRGKWDIPFDEWLSVCRNALTGS